MANPPTTPLNVNQAVLLSRFDTVQGDLVDLSKTIRTMTEAWRLFEKEYLVAHIDVESRARAAHERLDLQQKQIELFETRLKDIEKLMPYLRSIAYILTALSVPATLSLVALLWQLITHQVIMP